MGWRSEHDDEIRSIFPEGSFSILLNGVRIDGLVVDWQKRRLPLGEILQQATTGATIEFRGAGANNLSVAVIADIQQPARPTLVRKRLSHSEYQHRHLKWFAREDDLFSRLLAGEGPFLIEVAGRQVQGRTPDFDKRILPVGDALRAFTPGDDLLLQWASNPGPPTLIIAREEIQNTIIPEATTALRAMVTRLISRPLGSFNEGEVKGLILLLDENKKLWEQIAKLRDENQRLTAQVNMLEAIFEQLRRNSFFQSRKMFEDWVSSHISMFEKGIRVLHRHYDVVVEHGRKKRLDLLCQDRKGVLTAVAVLFEPTSRDLRENLAFLNYLRQHVDTLGQALTKGLLKTAEIRCMVITNVERPGLVETCMQHRVKLGMAMSGCVIDVFE